MGAQDSGNYTAEPQLPGAPQLLGRPQLPARFLGVGPGLGPMAHEVGPMSYDLVLCPLALSNVLWPCPTSYAPVLGPMALSDV